MKTKNTLILLCALLAAGACRPSPQGGTTAVEPGTNAVIETIMSRRSIRQYMGVPVGRDTMDVILRCGINAPNGQNKQSWAVRVVDNPEWLHGLASALAGEGMSAEDVLQRGFRGAPTVAFIAKDTSYPFSETDCGLLTENMLLSAWSLGIGSICLGGVARQIAGTPAAQPYLDRLQFGDGFELVLCVGFGYPAEQPEARPRDDSKYRFID